MPELEILRAAGHITCELVGDEQLLEPEFRLFFRDVWPRMSEDERGVVREFLWVLRTRVKRRDNGSGGSNG